MRLLPPSLLTSNARTIASVGVLGFALAVIASLARGGDPAPHVHDEFSYLLASDTFAHGRLTNPTHPMWEFFETFHVIQQPTYASKYPPAQGLFLAIGQVLTGQPIVGVWLGYGLMCAAFTWMLLAWTGRRWAFLGGVTAALFLLGVHADKGNWGASYWGGAVAALGGALLFGAARRITTRPSSRDAVMLALGVGLLANSRPYEGALLCLPVAIYLLVWIVRDRGHRLGWRLRTIVAPAAVTLVVIGGGMAAYNARVTGSPSRLPYLEHERAQGSSSTMLFGKPNVVSYRHEAMRRFYEDQPPVPASMRDVITKWVGTLSTYRAFYVPVYMIVLVFLVPAVLRDRSMWLPVAAVVVVTGGLLLETWSFGHYAAPAAAPLLLIGVAAARRLNLLTVDRARLGQRVLAMIFACIVLSAFAYPAYRFAARGRYADKWFEQRATMIDRLESDGGRHLIIVRYDSTHDVGEEWVYNSADIDGSPVVWARSMGDRDSVLVRHFKDRRVWTLDVDRGNGRPQLVGLGASSAKGPG